MKRRMLLAAGMAAMVWAGGTSVASAKTPPQPPLEQLCKAQGGSPGSLQFPSGLLDLFCQTPHLASSFTPVQLNAAQHLCTRAYRGTFTVFGSESAAATEYDCEFFPSS